MIRNHIAKEHFISKFILSAIDIKGNAQIWEQLEVKCHIRSNASSRCSKAVVASPKLESTTHTSMSSVWHEKMSFSLSWEKGPVIGLGKGPFIWHEKGTCLAWGKVMSVAKEKGLLFGMGKWTFIWCGKRDISLAWENGHVVDMRKGPFVWYGKGGGLLFDMEKGHGFGMGKGPFVWHRKMDI